jgi:hypothetical protein
MAQCKFCHKKGIFLSTDEEGLCKNCQPIVYNDLRQRADILENSIDIIEKSKNIDTIISRIDVGLEHLEHLREYQRLGIRTIQPKPSESIEAWKERKREKIKEVLENEFIQARDKSRNAKTISGRVNPFNKVLEKITKYQMQLDDISELEKLEQDVIHEKAKVNVAHYIEQGDKAEFKSQKKKALDQYLEALYSLRHDPIPDDKQRNAIQYCERKIVELGGEVPGKKTLK